MTELFLVSDQKAVIQAYSTFKEGKDAYDHMCSAHIKELSDNPTFSYRRTKTDLGDGQVVYQFRCCHKRKVNGQLRFFQECFSFQIIKLP